MASEVSGMGGIDNEMEVVSDDAMEVVSDDENAMEVVSMDVAPAVMFVCRDL